MDLTDEQWEVLKPSIPVPPRRADGRGRPWRDSRAVLNGILWILRTGAQWQDLPARILQVLATDLQERGERDLAECFIDGTFVVAKKGGPGG